MIDSGSSPEQRVLQNFNLFPLFVLPDIRRKSMKYRPIRPRPERGISQLTCGEPFPRAWDECGFSSASTQASARATNTVEISEYPTLRFSHSLNFPGGSVQMTGQDQQIFRAESHTGVTRQSYTSKPYPLNTANYRSHLRECQSPGPGSGLICAPLNIGHLPSFNSSYSGYPHPSQQDFTSRTHAPSSTPRYNHHEGSENCRLHDLLQSRRSDGRQRHFIVDLPSPTSRYPHTSMPPSLEPFRLLPVALPGASTIQLNNEVRSASQELMVRYKPNLLRDPSSLKVAVTKLHIHGTYEIRFEGITAGLVTRGGPRQRFLCTATRLNTLVQVHQGVEGLLVPARCDFAWDLFASLRSDKAFFEDSLWVIANQLYLLLPEN